jgi:hypothetical protein
MPKVLLPYSILLHLPMSYHFPILQIPLKLQAPKQPYELAMDCAKKKIATKFDRLQIETQCVLEVCKHILVRLMGSIVHKIFRIKAGVGLLVSITISILEKDNDLVVLVKNNEMAYAKEVRTTWDPSKQGKKKMQAIISHHESQMIHG